MSPDEALQGQEAPRRKRGRPPGSKTTTTARARRKRLEGGELIGQLNHMVAELIKENRKLRRQVVKLTERGSAAASTTVERGLRTISRRVQRALGGAAKKRRTTAAPANGRRKTATKKKRKAS